MYKDLILEHLNKPNTNIPEKRFQGIYEVDEKSNSSSSEEDEVKFGSKKLSKRKKEKLINYLFFEINVSR